MSVAPDQMQNYVEAVSTEAIEEMRFRFVELGFDDVHVTRCGHEDTMLEYPEGAIASLEVGDINLLIENINLVDDCAACMGECRAEQIAA